MVSIKRVVEETLKQGRLPSSKGCYVCGQQNKSGFRMVFDVVNGKVRGIYRPQREKEGFGGVLHGGVISTLLDETMAWAPVLITGRFHMTAEMTVRYLRPFPMNRDLVVEGWTEKTTRRLSYTAGEARDDQGTVYARATGKYTPLDPEESDAIARQLLYDADSIRITELPWR